VNLLANLPRESATSQRLRGVDPGDDWTTETHLLAVVANALLVGNWQRQGRKGAPRPKLIEPPGSKGDVERFGGESLPPEQVDAILAARYTTPPAPPLEEVTDDDS